MESDVQRLTGISDSTVAHLERGKRKPRTDTLHKLLNLYSITSQRWEHMERTLLEFRQRVRGVASG